MRGHVKHFCQSFEITVNSLDGLKEFLEGMLVVASENLNSCISMVKSGKDRMRNNVSEPLGWACAGRILLERNVSSCFIIISEVFRKNSPKVLFAENDQMISALAPDRPNQAFNIAILPGRTERGRPVSDAHRPHPCLEDTWQNARSLSRMRYFGALSQGNASVICRASHSAVGFRVTAVHSSRRRRWLRTRNA